MMFLPYDLGLGAPDLRAAPSIAISSAISAERQDGKQKAPGRSFIRALPTSTQ